MKVYICDDFEGHWPIGTAAVIFAHDEPHARKLLAGELISRGLKGDDFNLMELSSDEPCAYIIRDGDY